MANWMKCDYHNACIDPSAPNKGLPINREPVNLDLCETILISGKLPPFEICFQFSNNFIKWKFINAELRDLEYERAMRLIKLAEDEYINIG